MGNFKPTDEQELIRETMAGFAREVLRPAAREADEKNEVPEAVVQRGWELGLVQSPIPEAFGGYGDSYSALTGALLRMMSKIERRSSDDRDSARRISVTAASWALVSSRGRSARRGRLLPAAWTARPRLRRSPTLVLPERCWCVV